MLYWFATFFSNIYLKQKMKLISLHYISFDLILHRFRSRDRWFLRWAIRLNMPCVEIFRGYFVWHMSYMHNPTATAITDCLKRPFKSEWLYIWAYFFQSLYYNHWLSTYTLTVDVFANHKILKGIGQCIAYVKRAGHDWKKFVQNIWWYHELGLKWLWLLHRQSLVFYAEHLPSNFYKYSSSPIKISSRLMKRKIHKRNKNWKSY